MSTLTIHFENGAADPIEVKNCVVNEEWDASFVLPGDDDGQHDEIVEAMRTASHGELYYEFVDEMDGFMLFDLETKLFALWRGSNEGKRRGFQLDTEELLPYIDRIEITE
jgi:hypothetical protein